MFGLETFHIVFIAVLLAVVLLVRFFMNRAMNEARKNGIVDNGLEFNNDCSTENHDNGVSIIVGDIGYNRD